MKKEIVIGGLMALAFGALNIADYVTTKKIINTGGVELNPIANFFIKKKMFGFFKILTTVSCMGLIYAEKGPKTASKLMLGLYGIVVSNNVKEIVQHNKEIKK